VLLELTHRQNGDRGDVWVPITKKVYWPPTASASPAAAQQPRPKSEGSQSGER